MNKKPIEWAAQARQDLLDVVAYLRSERPSSAVEFLEKLSNKLDQIAMFPESGRPVPEEPSTSAREVLVWSWRIGYQPGDKIYILYVIHSARHFPPTPPP